MPIAWLLISVAAGYLVWGKKSASSDTPAGPASTSNPGLVPGNQINRPPAGLARGVDLNALLAGDGADVDLLGVMMQKPPNDLVNATGSVGGYTGASSRMVANTFNEQLAQAYGDGSNVSEVDAGPETGGGYGYA